MSSTEFYILSRLHDFYIDSLKKRVVRKIQRLPKNAMLSGDDSPLKNVWDEICVQVQIQYFYSWHLYESLIRDVCAAILNDLPDEVQFLLSYMACYDKGIDCERGAYYEEEVVDLLFQELLSYADDYRNQKIEDYIDKGYSIDI